MIRQLVDRLAQATRTLERFFQPPSTDTQPTPAEPQASTTPVSEIADPPTPSQGLSNEAKVIADIRAHLPQLKALALQKQLNYLQQWDAYIADINAPAEAGRFTDLEEDNKLLAEDYDRIQGEIFHQIRIYDRYCEYHELDYSAAWRTLLDELDGYLSGLSSAASRHVDEAHQIAKQAKSNL